MSSGFYKKPSEIKAEIEKRVQDESRSDDIKSKEFMQGSKKRVDGVPSFSQRPSQVKAAWEARAREETRADDVKSREFSNQTGWSKRRAQDVPSMAATPSQIKSEIEANVKREGKSDDAKARRFLKKASKETTVPRILEGPDRVRGGIEARVDAGRAGDDEKARRFLEDTTYRGVEPRKVKTSLIPLSVLFARPHKDQVRISPGGTYLAWRCRGRSLGDPNEEDNGVRNIFVQNRGTSKIRQVTFYNDVDACVHFAFTPDERSIAFLRETKRGNESYHLFAIEIDPFFNQDDKRANDPGTPRPARPRNLIKDPNMTCGIGFAGGIQMWTSPENPRHVYVSTSQIGPYAMFWDISRIDIDSAELARVETNVMSTKWGRLRVVILAFLARVLSLCCVKMTPPRVPVAWFPDGEMSFRGQIAVDLLNLGISFCARPKKGRWRTLHSCTFEETNLQLIGSSGGAGTARMEFRSTLSGGDQVDVHLCAFKSGGKMSDTTTYDRFDLKTGQYLKRVAGGNAKSDIRGFVAHPDGRAQFVYYEWEKTTLEVIPGTDGDDTLDWRKTRLAADVEYIRSYFQQSTTFQIVSRSSDDVWIIYAENDVGLEMFKGSPSAYFLFKKNATTVRKANASSSEVQRSIELIFPSRPEMMRYRLARMDPVHIKARDGENILCYLSRTPALSLIKGVQVEPPGPPPPLVMVIHGGPQARDSWGFNPLCQFLCSRGFRVLQVNYRGSTGFGARFLRLGMNGEFHKSVQADIFDAAEYATSSNDAETSGLDENIPPLPWANPDQLAVLGGSFGGYSALWGMSSNPGFYKCAVAICPISSVGAADEQSKKAFGGSPLIAKYWQRVFGVDVSKSRSAAMKASPMYQIDRIGRGQTKSSVALYHGENDPRAPIEHSYNMLKELKRCGIAGELVTFEGEGHGISKDENRLYMYYRIEEFLCKKFGMELFDTGDDTKKFARNTATVKWSAEYAEASDEAA